MFKNTIRSIDTLFVNNKMYLLLVFCNLFIGGNDKKALECAVTYLVFNPNDEETLNNKTYFMKKLGYTSEKFKARQVKKKKQFGKFVF